MKEDYILGQGCQCHAYSESECGCDVDWTPREVYELRDKCSNLDDQVSSAMIVIRGLELEIENLKASGIHTCRDQCQRPMCVMRRERDEARELEEKLAKAKAKLEEIGFLACCVLLERDEARQQRDKLAEALRSITKGSHCLECYGGDNIWIAEQALAAVKGGQP
jgi:hypothetical protein